MKTLYLHIGIFKTGSSALQVFFAQNIEELQTHGIHYPALAMVKSAQKGHITAGNGVWIARSLLPKSNSMSKPELRKDQLNLLGNILHENAGNDVLLSSEFFSDIEIDNMGALKAVADQKNYRIKLIIALREQVSYLESLYIQHVKRRSIILTPEEYLPQIYKNFIHLHYGRFLSERAALFGEENINVYNYHEGEIFERIFSILNIPSTSFSIPQKPVNLSLPTQYIPLFLKINRLKPNQSFSDQIVTNYAQLNMKNKNKNETLINPSLEAEIRHYYANENKIAAKDWFANKAIFEEKNKTFVDLTQASTQLNLDELAELICCLSVQQEKRINMLERDIALIKQHLNAQQKASAS